MKNELEGKPQELEIISLDRFRALRKEEGINRDIVEASMRALSETYSLEGFTWIWTANSLVVTPVQFDKESLVLLGFLTGSIRIAANFQNFEIKIEPSESSSIVISFVKSATKFSNEEDFLNMLQRSNYRGGFDRSLSPSSFHSSTAGENQIYNLAAGDAERAFLAPLALANPIQDSRKWSQLAKRIGNQIPGLRSLIQRHEQKKFMTSHFSLVACADDYPLAWLEAGEAGLKTWLKLEEQGYRVEAIKVSSLNIDDNVLRAQFKIPPGPKPVWLFRIGRPGNPSPWSPSSVALDIMS